MALWNFSETVPTVLSIIIIFCGSAISTLKNQHRFSALMTVRNGCGGST